MNEEYLQEGPEGTPPTGDGRVDGALAGLSRLPGLPADEHVVVLEEVHGQLRDILGELSEGSTGPTGLTGLTGPGRP